MWRAHGRQFRGQPRENCVNTGTSEGTTSLFEKHEAREEVEGRAHVERIALLSKEEGNLDADCPSPILLLSSENRDRDVDAMEQLVAILGRKNLDLLAEEECRHAQAMNLYKR